MAKDFDVSNIIDQPWVQNNEMKIWKSMIFPWPEHIFLNSKIFPGLESKFQIQWLSMSGLKPWVPHEGWYCTPKFELGSPAIQVI